MKDTFVFNKAESREEPVEDGMLFIDTEVVAFEDTRVIHLPTDTEEGGSDTDVPDCIIWNIDGADPLH